MAIQAVKLMEDRRITQLPVLDASGRLAGALHLHDLLLARVA
ncbi:MAG: CBS domain-containing protein [Burkholderiales bacterium]